jgi:hypothetical protein
MATSQGAKASRKKRNRLIQTNSLAPATTLDFVMTIRFALSSFLYASTMFPALAAPVMHCHVSDPAGTPLNVRAVPNGTIVSTLNNGTAVAVFSQTTQNGKAWVYIGTGEEELPAGWVFQEFLTCTPPD